MARDMEGIKMAEHMMRHRMLEMYQKSVAQGKRAAEREDFDLPSKKRNPSTPAETLPLAPLLVNAADTCGSTSLHAPKHADRRGEAFEKQEAAKRRRVNGSHSPVQPDPSNVSPDHDIGRRTSASPHTLTPAVPLPLGPPLSDQQEDILRQVLDGESVFVTGSAGTGKSVLIRAIIFAFQKRESERVKKEKEGQEVEKTWKLGITASTGLASLNIGGCTIHSWAGIGTCDQPLSHYITRIQRHAPTARRWKDSRALIVDEISLINGRVFDMLDQIGRRIRGSQRPFGGLQMIVCGDFLQLPPVCRRGDVNSGFAFQGDAWQQVFCPDQHHSLREVFRQTDRLFVRMLEDPRKGVVRHDTDQVLGSLQTPRMYVDGRGPTELFSQNVEVNYLNETNLARLPGDEFVFDAADVAGNRENGWLLTAAEATDYLNKNTRWPESVSIKIGAAVMLVTNCPRIGLANGSCGRVIDMMTAEEAERAGIVSIDVSQALPEVRCPVVKFTRNRHARTPVPERVFVPVLDNPVENPNKTLLASRRQIPLTLAWAMTIHKAQGQGLDRVRIDSANVTQKGQLYVALSRATSLEGLELKNFDKKRVKADKAVLRWMKDMRLI